MGLGIFKSHKDLGAESFDTKVELSRGPVVHVPSRGRGRPVIVGAAEATDIFTVSPLQAVTKPWMVLHTKARQEKAVARYLRAAGAVFYLPLITRVTLVRNRKLRSRVPLLSGYVFLSGDLEDGYAAVETRRVCQIIRVADQDRLIDELEQIRDALDRGAELYQFPFAVIGTRCRVRRGSLEGIEGVISRKLGSNRLALQVQTLGLGAVLEIDADLLEPLE